MAVKIISRSLCIAAISISFVSALPVGAEAGVAAIIAGSAASRGSRSASSDELMRGKVCTVAGIDSEDGERLYKCVDKRDSKQDRVRPSIRCRVIERTYTKFVYCSDGTRIGMDGSILPKNLDATNRNL